MMRFRAARYLCLLLCLAATCIICILFISASEEDAVVLKSQESDNRAFIYARIASRQKGAHQTASDQLLVKLLQDAEITEQHNSMARLSATPTGQVLPVNRVIHGHIRIGITTDRCQISVDEGILLTLRIDLVSPFPVFSPRGHFLLIVNGKEHNMAREDVMPGGEPDVGASTLSNIPLYVFTAVGEYTVQVRYIDTEFRHFLKLCKDMYGTPFEDTAEYVHEVSSNTLRIVVIP